MVDPNDAVFRIAEQTIVKAVSDEAGRQVIHHASNIQKFVKEYNQQLYAEMRRQKLFGQEKTPGVLLANGNPFGAEWTPLSESYSDRKARHHDIPSFYERKGDLARGLYARNSTRDFGAATVTVKTRGSGLDTSSYTVDAGGRPRFRAGQKDLQGRGVGGRFAPMEVFRSLVFTIDMKLFSKISGGLSPGSLGGIYPKAIVDKLGPGEYGRRSEQGGRQPSRPLLRPFLHWYATTNFRRSFSTKFGIEV